MIQYKKYKKMKNVFIKSILVLCFFLSFVSCSTVPHTERSQLMLAGTGREISMGEEAWNDIKKQYPKSNNRKYINALRRVGSNIAKIADKPEYNWEFMVFASQKPNAFCLPGGKIGFFEGIFKFMDNDAELAAVTGHEIAHAIARHGGERMSHSVLRALIRGF